MQTYKLVSDGSMLLVDPWMPGLSKECTYFRVGYSPFNQAKTREREELFHLQQIDGRMVGYIADGLTDKIRRWFDRKGIPYTFENKHYWKELPVPEWGRVDFSGLRDGQEEALVAVATNYNGVIDACTGYGKTWLLVQVCRMYPKLNIVIVTSRKAVVRSIYERLREYKDIRDQIGAICTWKDTGPNHRIVVTTTKSMEKTNYDKCDILMFDECHALAAPGTAYKLASFRRARKFGLSASPEGRGDKADMVLEGMIGPVRFSLTYQEGVAAGAVVPIDVHIYTVTGKPIWHRMHLALKRFGLWQNEVRNKMIADIAKTFGDQQVLIMCDTVEHVMHIKKYLPEYTAVYDSCSTDRYKEYVDAGMTTDPLLTSKELIKIQSGFEKGEIRHIVGTMIWKEGVDFKHLLALIRADGQAGSISSTQIPGRLSRTVEGKDKAVLVDFYDSFDKRLEGCSKARLKTYGEKGWNIEYRSKL
jgi:superfamily II DNA or RNA helicase